MKGINRFEANYGIKEERNFSRGRDCVFISHSRKDKTRAREIASFLMELGVDIYFDEKDRALQLADEQRDHKKVVACIEDGIIKSTLLLGLITENTKDSWWVPYEIGSATGHGKVHAHLIHAEVSALPSYIQASQILPDMESLKEFIPRQVSFSQGMTAVYLEQLNRQLTMLESAGKSPIVPNRRSMLELSFY